MVSPSVAALEFNNVEGSPKLFVTGGGGGGKWMTVINEGKIR